MAAAELFQSQPFWLFYLYRSHSGLNVTILIDKVINKLLFLQKNIYWSSVSAEIIILKMSVVNLTQFFFRELFSHNIIKVLVLFCNLWEHYFIINVIFAFSNWLPLIWPWIVLKSGLLCAFRVGSPHFVWMWIISSSRQGFSNSMS